MTPEISEFSYGFALTNEIVGWETLSGAPIFPSLIEEGRDGGGYDVRLDFPAVPLFLQFKRAECMTRKSAREIQMGARLRPDFYRFHITQAGKSNQHEMLLHLDDGTALVFYAAPRFHLLSEINQAWASNTVASRSAFFAPQAIGHLGNQTHTVAYDRRHAFLCSEPKEIGVLDAKNVIEKAVARLEADPRPLRKKIPEMLDHLISAEKRAREMLLAKDDGLLMTIEADFSVPLADAVPQKAPRKLSEEQQNLRTIADLAARAFDAQLVVLQPPA